MATAKSTLSQFIAVTGATVVDAKNLLEACNGNLDMAIGMHMDGGGGGSQSEAAASASEESVRAPIPQTNELLVQEAQAFGFRANKRRKGRSVFDGFRDFQAEAKQQEEQQKAIAETGTVSSKKRTLEDLFRPPVDLTYKGTFSSAREMGTSQNRWLLINIQNVQEFPCQVLNRDVWSNLTVRSLVKQRFILWQVYHDTDEGKKYTQFYPVEQWPYVSIIDPRTGEKMREWHKLDAMTFCDLVGEFLSEHPSPDGSTSSSPPSKKQKTKNSIIDDSEDSQLMAAIQASMSETKAKPSPIEFDTDSDAFESGEEATDLETFSDSEEADDTCTKPESSSKGSSKTIPGVVTSSGKISSSVCTAGVTTSQQPTTGCVHNTGSNSNSNSTTVKHGSVLNGTQEDLSSKASSDSLFSSEQNGSPKKERWKAYLGDDNDEKMTILLRFPGGQRQQLHIPRSSHIRALTEYMVESGYSQLKHELLTNFPKRNLSLMDPNTTLASLGTHSQETVFIHETEES